MEAQTPAEGILKRKSVSGDYASYLIECECTCEDHAVDAWIEINKDDDVNDIDVSFYVKTYVPVWHFGLFQRIKLAVSILFNGEVERQHSILLKPQAAKNWISAMQSSIDELEATKD